ncbi:hypothetical protein ACFOOM_12115 [Streptomyces echinoruber]|jgi:hypothetical protein|uniref:Uncharacterized protein n=1 Tax=Streptomyces echinoruber TaxID=68898 RepID=A0A918RIP0_9ACTN|nr:hypothetical protein [Streptomyces echinoruber]GHA01498.1 hypothetical protein GCM10010389_46090 [Streptomyces echinoruber]
MASPSRVPELIDAFVAVLQAAPGLTGVQVVDGPLVTASAASEWVFVGYDADPEGEFQTAQTSQQWAGLGAHAKNEDILLTCVVLVRPGNTDVRACRIRTFEIFAEVEAAVRANPSLGLPPPTVCGISETAFHTEQTDRGVQGRMPFTLTCTTRI